MLPPIRESLRFFVATLPDSYYDFPPRIRNLHSSRRSGGGGGGDREAVSADGGLPAEKFGKSYTDFCSSRCSGDLGLVLRMDGIDLVIFPVGGRWSDPYACSSSCPGLARSSGNNAGAAAS